MLPVERAVVAVAARREANTSPVAVLVAVTLRPLARDDDFGAARTYVVLAVDTRTPVVHRSAFVDAHSDVPHRRCTEQFRRKQPAAVEFVHCEPSLRYPFKL